MCAPEFEGPWWKTDDGWFEDEEDDILDIPDVIFDEVYGVVYTDEEE